MSEDDNRLSEDAPLVQFCRYTKDRNDKWKEAVYVYTHPASVRYHSHCVYSPCAEVSDDD